MYLIIELKTFFLIFSFEHPAGGYKKIFETVEELNEPLPATVTGISLGFHDFMPYLLTENILGQKRKRRSFVNVS